MLALFLTIFLEFFPVFFLFAKERSALFILFSVSIVNMITNPIANYLYPAQNFFFIETGVLIAESLLFTLLFGVSLKRGTILSIAANLPTIVLSLVLLSL